MSASAEPIEVVVSSKETSSESIAPAEDHDQIQSQQEALTEQEQPSIVPDETAAEDQKVLPEEASQPDEAAQDAQTK